MNFKLLRVDMLFFPPGSAVSCALPASLGLIMGGGWPAVSDQAFRKQHLNERSFDPKVALDVVSMTSLPG